LGLDAVVRDVGPGDEERDVEVRGGVAAVILWDNVVRGTVTALVYLGLGLAAIFGGSSRVDDAAIESPVAWWGLGSSGGPAVARCLPVS
jgi:hypothetical protein